MRSYFAFIAEEVMRERLAEARREALVRQSRGSRPTVGLRRRVADLAAGLRRAVTPRTADVAPTSRRLDAGPARQ
jgi:hypothetical protein